MAHLTVEQRLDLLEAMVAELQQQLAVSQAPPEPWWKRVSGSFKDEPAFGEVLKFGRVFQETAWPPAEGDVP